MIPKKPVKFKEFLRVNLKNSLRRYSDLTHKDDSPLRLNSLWGVAFYTARAIFPKDYPSLKSYSVTIIKILNVSKSELLMKLTAVTPTCCG